MTAQPPKKEIFLGEDFGEVTIRVNGVRIDVRADGTIQTPINANDDKTVTNVEPQIGDRMSDGTIYAGVSPDTGKPMYATPADASLTMTFNQAKEYSAQMDAHGHRDWRVPTKAELNVLLSNRAAIGGFNVTGSPPGGWYWSSSSNGKWYAWDQRCSDGFQFLNAKGIASSVRCVR